MRATYARRLCALASAALVGISVGVVPAASAADAPAPGPARSSTLAAQVDALNADIDRVGAELAEGAAAYEVASEELARLVQQQFATAADRDALQDDADDSRAALSGMARSAYMGGMPPVLTALLSGDPRAVSDLAYVRRSSARIGVTHGQLARELDTQTAGAGRAVEQTAALRLRALAQREALAGQLRALTEKTDRLTTELSAAAERLSQARVAEQELARAAEQARAVAAARDAAARDAILAAAAVAASAAAGGGGGPGGGAGGGGPGGCQPPSAFGEANGFLSDAGLCALDGGNGHRLRTDAARAFDALDAARQSQTGSPICVTDSYRSYPEQVDVFRRKPGLAATPGRSQHGWGMAVDLCGGVQTFGSEAHGWMQRNAPQYGWVHPAWARADGSKPEAWHWEFVGGPAAGGR